MKVDYPKRSAAVIKEAYFTQASTTDYNGVYRGFYLTLKQKKPRTKHLFPLKLPCPSNRTYESMPRTKWGLLCLVMVFVFEALFYLNSVHLIAYWDAQKEKGRKSLPLSLIEELGIEIKTGISPRIPYLDAVDFYLSTLSIEGESKNGK